MLKVRILIQLSDSTVFDQNTFVNVMLCNTLLLNLKPRKGTISLLKSYFIHLYFELYSRHLLGNNGLVEMEDGVDLTLGFPRYILFPAWSQKARPPNYSSFGRLQTRLFSGTSSLQSDLSL